MTLHGMVATLMDISYICKRMGSLHECEEWISELRREHERKSLEMVQISINALKDHDVELARSISNIENGS